MCKELTVINRVDLGNRILGYELYNHDNQDIIGKTERQIKSAIKAGIIVHGFKYTEKDSIELDQDFVKVLMVKTGVGNLKPNSEDSIINIVYTVVGQSKSGYEVVTSRFWHGTIPTEKIKVLYDMGAVNGIKINDNGDIELIQPSTKQEEPNKNTNKTPRKGSTS